jgi:hypothetical protein
MREKKPNDLRADIKGMADVAQRIVKKHKGGA